MMAEKINPCLMIKIDNCTILMYPCCGSAATESNLNLPKICPNKRYRKEKQNDDQMKNVI